MKNVIIFTLTNFYLLVGVLILTTQALPIGLQKYLSGNNYQVVSGPKEFFSKYDQPTKGSYSRIEDESSNSSDSEYVVYGKIFILKKKSSAKVRNQNDKEANIIIPSYPVKLYNPQHPIQNAKSEVLDPESIVFPKDSRSQKSEYKRFDPVSLSDATNVQKSADMAMGRVENGNFPPILGLSRKADAGKLQKTTEKPDTIFENSGFVLDQDEGASTTADVFKMHTRKQEMPLGVVSIQELEKWADMYKTTTMSPQIENSNSTGNETDLSFQSLFIVPSLKNPQGGCPEGKRKNHAGVCVTPYVHKGNSKDDSGSTQAKPIPSSLPIQSTLSSLMESLRSVELQALQALLGSTAPNMTAETSIATPDDVQIGSRHNFPISADIPNTSDTSNPTTTTTTTVKPNYVYSLLTPLSHRRNSDLTEPSTERSLLEILQEYGKINFDFSKVQQLQQRYTSTHKHT